MKSIISKELSWIPGKTGKQGQYLWLPAWVHMRDVEGIMSFLYRDWLPASVKNMMSERIDPDDLEKLCRFLALVHDIGKLTPVFVKKLLLFLPEIQIKLQSLGFDISKNMEFLEEGNSPHGLAGEAVLISFGCPEWLAVIVGAHHGKPVSEEQEYRIDRQMNSAGTAQNYYGPNGRDSKTKTLWESIRREWYEYCLSESGIENLEKLKNPGTPVQMVLTGLLIMADWMGSNSFYFPLLYCDDNGDRLDFEQRAAYGWNTAALPPAWHSNIFEIRKREFLRQFSFEPNMLQRETIDVVRDADQPGILIIEAQMGVGKTEAALAATEILAAKSGSGGVFFGLPTQATANGIFPRLVKWAEKLDTEDILSIRLAHGSADLNEVYQSMFCGHGDVEEDAEEPLIVHPWFEGNKQALLADFVIGTVDQLLLGSLKQKHIMLRHLGISGKIVIIDECHAYDAYMNGYLDRMLEWLGKYGTPVIILSATLPVERRSELIDAYLGKYKGEKKNWRLNRCYPLLTWTDGGEVFQKELETDTSEKRVQIKKLPEEDLSAFLKEKLESGGCAGIIVNTVRKAQTLWRMIREQLPEKRVMLIHAQVTMPDRAEKEKCLVSNIGKNSLEEDRNNLIVIGTQVLEQSLDIDFDLLITELCPMDLLLQRIGRLHRHKRLRPEILQQEEVAVLNCDGEFDPGSAKVYGEWLLERTRELLPNEIVIPEMIAELVQETYKTPETKSMLPGKREMWRAHYDLVCGKKQRSKSFQIRKPQKNGILAGFLDMALQGDQQGEAAVRDGEESITVLLVVKHSDGAIGFLPWLGKDRFFSDHVPEEKDCIQIARQQIRLPAAVSGLYWNQKKNVIEQLEETTRTELGEWQQSRWINGELFLILDDTLSATLCGWKLHYDRDLGLTYEREYTDG